MNEKIVRITILQGIRIVLKISSLNKLSKNDLLLWSIIITWFLLISQGNWAQPTILGFSTLVAGLTLASLINKKEDNL